MAKRSKQVAAPNLEGKEATIKAGSESLYGVKFSEDTKGTLIKDYARTAYYYGIRLDAKRVVLVPREFVMLPKSEG